MPIRFMMILGVAGLILGCVPMPELAADDMPAAIPADFKVVARYGAGYSS